MVNFIKLRDFCQEYIKIHGGDIIEDKYTNVIRFIFDTDSKVKAIVIYLEHGYAAIYKKPFDFKRYKLI